MDKRTIFLNEVTSQIKSKEAKKYVSDELNFHIRQAKTGLMKKGLTEAEAEEKAVEELGSPVKLGQQMNKLHRPKVDWLLVLLLGTTFGLGFLPMFSLGYMGERHFSLFKIITVILGFGAALGLMLADYRKWKKHGWLFYIIGIGILLLLRFFPNVTINGVPLLKLGPLTIESQMAVPFFFLAWASFFHSEKLKVWQFILLFIFPFLLFASVPSFSNLYIYSIMAFVMLCWSKFSRRTIVVIWTLTIGSLLTISFIAWNAVKDYQKVRLLAFLNPEKFSEGSGYMILKVKALLGKAGWFGNPSSKDFIPEAHTNFVFVSFTYFYGWLFAAALVLILALFVARIIMITLEIKDSYGKLLLIGAVTLYGIQLATNIGMSLGIFPLMSMSLPFISYGLMPTLLNAVLIGVVLSVYRRKDMTVRENF